MQYLKINAQTTISVDAGITYNKLDFNADTRNLILTSKEGYIVNINLNHKLSKLLTLETSPGLLQKNYNTKNKNNIYQDITNTYIQIPVTIKHKTKLINKLTVSGSFGIYYAYWLRSNIEGVAPNIFELSSNAENSEVIKLERIKYAHDFNSEQDNRSEFGWVGKIGLEYKIMDNFSCSMTGHYYQSLTSQQKQAVELHRPGYNRTYAISFGLVYYFN